MDRKNREFVTRSLTASVEVRDNGGKERHISGVIPYDKESEVLGWGLGFNEVVRSGAFSKTIKEQNVRCLWAHNTQYVLGNTDAKTLVLEDRADGLHFDVAVPDTSWGGDVFASVSRRDAPGVSFGFEVIKDAWEDRGRGKPSLRELLEVRLMEISVGVAFPAYPDSDSAASRRALFASRGIDLDRIAGVLERTEGALTEKEDVEAVRSAAEALTAMIPEKREEPAKSTPAEPQTDCTREARERELLILEAEQSLL